MTTPVDITTSNQPQQAPIGVSKPATIQYNFRQLIGQLLQWNPDLPANVAKAFLNQSYRRIIDYRLWYGLMVRGQVNVPNAYTTGSVTVTSGSATITGVGTAWTNAMQGIQFRVGFQFPIYNILQINSPTQLTLDQPWGGRTQSGVGYQIFQNLASFGNNIKRLLAVVNQMQGYRMRLDIPQEVLNLRDTWRTTVGWTYLVANREASSDGQPQYELYPAPTFQQSFPFLAYIQPPDMVTDNDFPYLNIRADIVLYGAIPFALRFRGKSSNYYDLQTAAYFDKLFIYELDKLSRNDDNYYPKDLIWEYERYPITGYGASFWQQHDLDSMPL